MDTREIFHDLEGRRKRLGLTVTAVADKAGITTMTYRRWRHNTVQPTFENLLSVKAVIENAEDRLMGRAS